MAHYSGILVAALAAVMVLGGGTLQAAAADAKEETEAVSMTETETAATPEARQSVEGGWLIHNGKQYYVFSDGTKAVGETMIGGVPYLFGFSGALKTDWQTVDSKRYYFDPATGEPVFGWIEYFSNRYYVVPETGKVTGFFDIEDKHYAFSEDGALLTGEFYADGVRYFADPETGELHRGCYMNGSDIVLTDDTGAVTTGWYELEDGRRYYISPETGEAVYGLASIEGNVYYLTPEEGAVRGVIEIAGIPCPFDEVTGARTTGWFDYAGVRYYFDPDAQSTLFECFADIHENTYYFTANGSMAVGMTVIDGYTYYFDESGIMQTGDVTLNGAGYHFGEDGRAVTGWLAINDAIRYYGVTGVMATGWTLIGSDTYFFDADGTLCTGLVSVDGAFYFLNEDGVRTSGWVSIDDVLYFFRADGMMAVDTTLRMDGYIYSFDENGVLISKEEAPDVLDVVDYKQKDPLWANEKLGTYSTIGKVGCLVTSMAMLHSYTTGTETTPIDMRDMLSFTSGGALVSWDLITDLGYSVETFTGGKPNTTVLQHIYELLQQGCPVVLGSKKSSGQHYVIITGYTGDGVTYSASDFTINDPGYSKRFVLSDHLAEYGSLYKLIY